METIGISKFLKDQIKKKGNNWASDSTLKKLLKTAQHKLNNKEYINGYRDGVIIIEIHDVDICKKINCPIVKISDKTMLKCIVSRRRAWEDSYLQIKAINEKNLSTGKIELILYRKDVLKESNEQATDMDWDLIAVHSIPKGIKKLPMKPETMMRNQLQLKGGTKGYYSSEEWAESVHFWQKHSTSDDY
ncbi:MAG: hypothetical protein CMG00_04950 [Candidatus Marinimicrobia bacterium]|nr:hypothetical protein [Candidatus Neomarinimicrobiota bacterium]|tara:strand:+ start:149 stop:715 length:567 start_codon:yes stop_codon:yes gene_type:complete